MKFPLSIENEIMAELECKKKKILIYNFAFQKLKIKQILYKYKKRLYIKFLSPKICWTGLSQNKIK